MTKSKKFTARPRQALATCLFTFMYFVGVACSSPEQPNWTTFYEQSNFLATPNYDQTLDYLKRLADFSPVIRLKYMGKSSQGRAIPYVILDCDRSFDPKKAATSRKAVVMLIAGIHGGEIAGKDAGLLLIRDIATRNAYPELLRNIVLVFVPMLNVDGHERSGPFNRINQIGPVNMGWRTTALNLNLNRDFTKMDAPETRHLVALYNAWIPDFLIDAHTTDGLDHRYIITYGVETTQNIAEPVRTWIKDMYLPSMLKSMAKAGFPMAPYVWPISRKNLAQGIHGFVSPPRFSTGFAASHNRPSLLIEAHSLKTYKQRVDGTYMMARQTLDYINKRYADLKSFNHNADSSAKMMSGSFMPLTFTNLGKNEVLDFKGYNYRLEYDEYANDNIAIWENIPIDYKLPVYNLYETKDSARVPYAFIIPPEWEDLIMRIHRHGIKSIRLDSVRSFNATTYRFLKVGWAARSFEGRLSPDFEIEAYREKVRFPVGSHLIIMNQRTNRLIMHLLEPNSPDSFVKWGFMNSIFEEKEYAEPFILKPMIKKMIAENPGLLEDFREALRDNPDLARNPHARLHWFYMKSKYRDGNLNRYPICKIMKVQDLLSD